MSLITGLFSLKLSAKKVVIFIFKLSAGHNTND